MNRFTPRLWDAVTQPRWWLSVARLWFPLALLSLVMGGWLYQSERRRAIEGVVSLAQGDITQFKRELARAMNETAVELLRLASSRAMVVQADSKDPLDPAIANDLQLLMQTDAIFAQTCLQAHDGKPLLRVIQNGGSPVVVANELAPSDGACADFAQVHSLPRGQVHVSPVVLSTVEGRTAHPYRPVLRIGVATFTMQGERRGALVADVLPTRCSSG
jgi:hypothetical protein